MIVLARQRKPFSIRHEGGQSLVIVVLAMTVILAMAAVAIDVSQWYATRHQAQVAADSAALAGANCMAAGGTTTSCQSIPGTYASDNGQSSSNAQFNQPAAGEITVTVTAKGSNFFASSLGISAPTYTQKAIAVWTAHQTTCSTDCGAIFAGGSCGSGAGITLSSITGTINGAVVSDGNLSLSSISGTLTPETDYGPGCSYTASGVSGHVPQQKQLSATVPYPEDWRSGGNETLPACTFTASSSTAGTYYSASGGAWSTSQPSGSTDTMTVTSTNITIGGSGPIPAEVYCAPSGTAEISSFSGGASYMTLIGETVILRSVSGGPLSPCTSAQNSSCPSGNVLLMYQTGGGTMNLGSISGSINGTVFAPNATISISSLSGGTGFIEGNSVTASSISGYVGNGPSNISTGGSTSTGTDSLYQ